MLLIQRRADDAKVLLGGPGAAVAFSGGTVRHVVNERLRRRADDRNDVGPNLRRRARLICVVVDISRRHNHVLKRRTAFRPNHITRRRSAQWSQTQAMPRADALRPRIINRL